MNKKAVVFGGSGFLGSHVCDALVDSGYQVRVFDRRVSPYLKSGQEMIAGDILDELSVEKAAAGCAIVYNFAGISDIDEAADKPFESIKTNILGNAVILDACRKTKPERFVFASSIYVYSKYGSFYRSSKQACELLIENYNEVYGLPYTILRYGSLYGPRSDERNYIYHVLKQALVDGKIIREGDGEEIREYIHVWDAARCSVDILRKEFVNQQVIITGNQQLKVKDLLVMIKEILGNKINIEYTDPRDNYHYEVSPYTFMPKLAKRIVSSTYLDLGQGIFKSIQAMFEELNNPEASDGPVTGKQPQKRPRSLKAGIKK